MFNFYVWSWLFNFLWKSLQNTWNAVSDKTIFQNFPREHSPDPPTISTHTHTQKPAYGPALLTGLLLLDDSLRSILYGKTGKHKDHYQHNSKTSHKRTDKEQSQDSQHYPQQLKAPAKNIEVIERLIRSDVNTPNEIRVQSPSMHVG